MASVTGPWRSPASSHASMRTSPDSPVRLTTRAKPWYPRSNHRCADGKNATRCPSLPVDFLETPATERSSARLALASKTCAGCGGGAGSGVEAYIVLGICACACSARTCRLRSALAAARSS